MLELSRGWRMANPLEVRRRELHGAVTGAEPPLAGVFSPAANVLFTRPTRMGRPDIGGLPGALIDQAVDVLSLFDPVVDAQAITNLRNDGLNWPHCDGFIWPHLRPIVA